MATIELSGDELTVQRQGFDRILALQSRLTVPLEHVTGVRGGEHEASEAYKGYRVGTSVPGLFTEGSFYKHGDWVLWDVHNAAYAIAIDLEDEHYRRLIVEVEDPKAEIEAIKAALAAHAKPAGAGTGV